jgi:type I restriction enzyme S subunit
VTVATVKLAQVVDILSGFAFKSELFNTSEGMPLIRIRDVVRGFTETRYSGEFGDEFIVQNGDIVIGMDGNFNVAKWNGGPALLNQRVCKVKAHESILNENYLLHYLPRVLKKIEDATSFATVKHLSVKDIREIEIPFPPLNEQTRIAAILDQADALRVKRREALAKLDNLTQAIFIEMFGDPEYNPNRLPLFPLRDIVQLLSGFAFKSSDYVDEGIPLIRIGEVNKGGVSLETACFLPATYEKTYSRFLVAPGDLLMSLTGTTGKDDYGNVTILNDGFKQYLLNQRVACIKPIQTLVNKSFLYHILRNQNVKNKLISKSRGVRQANISNGDILELTVPVPSLELQKVFSDRVEAVEKIKVNYLISAQYLDTLFASLQHRAFRGEL